MGLIIPVCNYGGTKTRRERSYLKFQVQSNRENEKADKIEGKKGMKWLK